MLLLHTADWHLGQKFNNHQQRDEEQALALEWLLEVVRTTGATVLVVAGDVFDVSSPPISAERSYYHFLNALKTTTACRHVVITGGNHDSPSKLNAPRELLRAFDIHVVGAAPADPADTLLTLRDAQGEVELMVAAVPFLRERDVAETVPGENATERINRIREGIARYYAAVGEAASQQLAELGSRVPVVATGHLVATGASTSGEQRNIYLGNLDNISADAFPNVFDYIALGHIHRPQRVAKQERIQYSGSLIPLSFSEHREQKSVVLVELAATGGLIRTSTLPAPMLRRLESVQGRFDAVVEALQALHDPAAPFPVWAKVLLEPQDLPADASDQLRALTRDLNIEILRLEIDRSQSKSTAEDEEAPLEQLKLLSEETVFRRRCEAEGLSEAATEELVATFRELVATLDF